MPEDDELLPIDAQAEFGPAFVMPVTDEEPEEEVDQAQQDLDPRARQDFLGLLYLGWLEEETWVAGHRFLLRTPSQDERLEMGLVHKPFLNTVSTEPAWRLITCASFVRRIDNQDEPEPLLGQRTSVRDRFEWLRGSIHSKIVTEMLYDRCLLLDGRERAAVEYLDRLGESAA